MGTYNTQFLTLSYTLLIVSELKLKDKPEKNYRRVNLLFVN